MQNIFIHGLGQKPSSWDKIISLMPEPAHSVCPDLFALMNGKATNYTNLYRSFADYCNNMSAPLNLCGLSLGGVLALNYAVDYPDKVQSLVLIAAQYKMPKILLKLQNIIFKVMPKSVFIKMGFQKKDFIALTKSMTELNFSDKLKDISCAAVIICGEKDGANKKAAIGLSKKISSAELHFIENAGHEVNVNSPDILADILLSFCQKKEI